MTDTASRNPSSAAQFLADALLRTVSGAQALFCLAGLGASSNQTELGIAATPFTRVVVGPVVVRKLRPTFVRGGTTQWELLVSATSVAQQVNTLNVESAQALFGMTLSISIAEQDYLIESVASNEAFGATYLYRLVLSEARPQAI